MAKFMNAELLAIKESLTCGHCKSIFNGTDSQAWKVKYESRTVYCSVLCRKAGIANKRRENSKPVRVFGPCKNCGEMFESKDPKVYCTLKCYTSSSQFREMLKENRENMPPRKRVAPEQEPCAECGELFDKTNATKSRPAKKYCSHICYRVHRAKAFDRWTANPKRMALPQNYDEFLTQENLKCLVEGCNWVGQHLTTHMNIAHGVPTDEFKRATGFNLGTGVVAFPLATKMSKRDKQGVALSQHQPPGSYYKAISNRKPTGYRSIEGRESMRKAQAIMSMTSGPLRDCKGCGKEFRQKTSRGRTLYCSPECRDECYAKELKSKAKIRQRNADGTFKWIERTIP